MSQQVFSAKNLPRELQEPSNSTRAANYLQKGGLTVTLYCSELDPDYQMFLP